MYLITISNWASAAAIWFILIVCWERLVVIRYPLKARKYRLFSGRIIIPANIVLTGLLTFYSHFSYDCFIKTFCNGTQPYALCTFIGDDGL
uniref:G-protein coupled receptors family 1 profile domain-containing protein n=1 Tax=Acrobeloides nanus TaxID=290746 RepID=A0A914D1B7_9BILA